MTTYRLSTYDPGAALDDDWGWVLRLAGLAKWGLRAAIREARATGYDDDLSILVEREP
jgi:hypothetical protein